MSTQPPSRAITAGHTGVRRLLRLVPMVALVAVGLVVVIGLAREAAREFHNLRTAGLDNIQWTASQLEVDVLRLELTAQQALLGEDLGPVRTRFDVLFSRVNILHRGQVNEEMADDPRVAAGLEALRAFLDAHVDAVDGTDAELRAALPALRADIADLHGPTRMTILRILDHFSQAADSQRAALAELLMRVALVTGALLALLLGLVALLVRLHSRQQRAQAELLVARDAALAGQRAKASFVAVMSHEMRTPLNGVLASLEIVKPDIREPKLARFVALAHASALQLMHQINDVLDISRIEAGRVEVTPVPFALVPFLDEMASALRPLAEARDNRILLRPDTDLPEAVIGDSFRIRQVLQNFLSNAIKFTEGGVITLSARRLPTTPPSDAHWIEFAVSDTGIGISAADLERVFEDFVMLDPTYSREVGGSGLGLAICRRLTRAMDGEIGAESVPGQGSRFWVRLPLPATSLAATGPAQAPEAPTVPAVDGPAAQGPQDTAAERLKLLVVDDNAVNRTVIAQMLHDEGHAPSLAATGAEAIALAAQTRFDAILMDISMPEMDGVTAAQHVRSGGASADAPIFALTAHAMPDELARFTAAGLRTTLLKPVRRSALRAALAELPPGAAPEDDAPDRGGVATTGAPGQPAGPVAQPPQALALAPQPAGTAASAASETALPLVDPAILREQLELLGQSTLADVRAQFRADAERLFAALDAAVQGNDMQSALTCAHELKGAAATLGLQRLADTMRRLEAAARDGDRDGCAAALAAGHPVWQQTQGAFSLPGDGVARGTAGKSQMTLDA